MQGHTNVLFLTQGRTLSLFRDLATDMAANGGIDGVGFYVTDSAYFDRFCHRNPDFLGSGAEIVKEWEILAKAERVTPDMAHLRALEERLGDPVLWNAAVADRRLFFGRRAVREQDYTSRYGHDRLLAILQTGADEMEALFDRLQPDLVVGFICVTMGEYLASLVAHARGIPFLDLRPTRIRNYFYAGETVQEPSDYLETVYRNFLRDRPPGATAAEARAVIAEIRADHAMYEGVMPVPGQQAAALAVPAGDETGAGEADADTAGSLQRRLVGLVRDLWAYNFGRYRADNHYEGRIAPRWFYRIKLPLRLWRMEMALTGDYLTDTEQLRDMDFAFFPLHKEPEVTLLVYGRPYLNQIEAIRNIARSLPVGMKLVVKEHPGAIGYRPLAYYRKLIGIPNVVLASPRLTSREVLAYARLVTVIGGSVGLEALVRRLPVLALGRVPFSFLPESMIRGTAGPDRLAEEIAALLGGHDHDEDALVAYFAAVMTSSVPVDFYSVLIGRRGVHRPAVTTGDGYDIQIRRLGEYLCRIAVERGATAVEHQLRALP